jgi:hypothetical protein
LSSATIAARSVARKGLETAAVFWNGSKIQRRFRERIKRLISIADPAGNGVTRADTKPQARPG